MWCPFLPATDRATQPAASPAAACQQPTPARTLHPPCLQHLLCSFGPTETCSYSSLLAQMLSHSALVVHTRPPQFRSNMADFKVHENTQLLVQVREQGREASSGASMDVGRGAACGCRGAC